jgi:uncharacterized SAM-binding protein YcdF (DUF218 family)
MKFFLKIIKIAFVTLLALTIIFLGFNLFLLLYGQSDSATFNEDAVIVLGAGLNGESPSMILRERLQAALRYHEQNPSAVIVVSGGLGDGVPITEALAMERYLVRMGVPPEMIIKEETSTNTRENIAFSKSLLDAYFNDEYKIVVITSDFHIFRSVMIARKNGLDSTQVHSKIPKRLIPWYYFRETASVLYHTLFYF